MSKPTAEIIDTINGASAVFSAVTAISNIDTATIQELTIGKWSIPQEDGREVRVFYKNHGTIPFGVKPVAWVRYETSTGDTADVLGEVNFTGSGIILSDATWKDHIGPTDEDTDEMILHFGTMTRIH